MSRFFLLQPFSLTATVIYEGGLGLLLDLQFWKNAFCWLFVSMLTVIFEVKIKCRYFLVCPSRPKRKHTSVLFSWEMGAPISAPLPSRRLMSLFFSMAPLAPEVLLGPLCFSMYFSSAFILFHMCGVLLTKKTLVMYFAHNPPPTGCGNLNLCSHQEF